MRIRECIAVLSEQGLDVDQRVHLMIAVSTSVGRVVVMQPVMIGGPLQYFINTVRFTSTSNMSFTAGRLPRTNTFSIFV